MTYTGPLDLLGSHARFDAVFGNDQAVIRLTNRSKKQRATEDIYIISVHKSTPFVISVGFICLCDSIQLKYVSTEVYDSQKIVADISLALSKLTMNYTVSVKGV